MTWGLDYHLALVETLFLWGLTCDVPNLPFLLPLGLQLLPTGLAFVESRSDIRRPLRQGLAFREILAHLSSKISFPGCILLAKFDSRSSICSGGGGTSWFISKRLSCFSFNFGMPKPLKLLLLSSRPFDQLAGALSESECFCHDYFPGSLKLTPSLSLMATTSTFLASPDLPRSRAVPIRGVRRFFLSLRFLLAILDPHPS